MIHLPPYHKLPSWQRFFAGVLLGAILAYPILLYMYGSMYEELLVENTKLTAEVEELKKQNEALLKDQEQLEAPLTVETLDISIINGEDFKMDRLITHQLEQLIQDEIDYLIGEELNYVARSEHLIISAIENKPFTVDEFVYYFEVTLLTIGPNMKINVQAKLPD